jgi:hypothetical protein
MMLDDKTIQVAMQTDLILNNMAKEYEVGLDIVLSIALARVVVLSKEIGIQNVIGQCMDQALKDIGRPNEFIQFTTH